MVLTSPRRVFTFSRESARALDTVCEQEFGIPSLILMENAATALLERSLTCLQDLRVQDPAALLLIGPGANGGDGSALARKLHNRGVRIVLAIAADPEKIKGDAGVNLAIARAMGLAIRVIDAEAPAKSLDAIVRETGAPNLIVDALFGTGLVRPLGPPHSDIVVWMNARRRSAEPGRSQVTLAVDIPSGLDCDTGRPLAVGADGAVIADLTVTLAGLKTGFANPQSRAWTGGVVVGDIGAPIEAMERLGAQASEPRAAGQG